MDEPNQPANWDTLTVPLFPLPNVVLLPKAVLPLHVFEERYKAMTADALAGPRRIAMSLLKPGWEKDYHSAPAIDPVVCVGRILTHELLPDGRYNLFLQGILRARIVQEIPYVTDPSQDARPYRLAIVRPIAEVLTDPMAVEEGRRILRRLFDESPLGKTSLGVKYAELLRSSLPMGDLVDLITFKFVDDIAAKQALLAEPDVSRRTRQLVSILDSAQQPVTSASVRMHYRPSMN